MAVCCNLRLLFEDLVPIKRDTRSVQLQDLYDTNRNNDFSDFFSGTFFRLVELSVQQASIATTKSTHPGHLCIHSLHLTETRI